MKAKRISSKKVHNLSETELLECDRLTYGTRGEKWYRLHDARRKSIRAEKAEALMIRDLDGRLIV